MPITKLELRRTLKEFYNPPTGQATFIELPAMKYIMVDGEGEPGGKSFQEAMGVLYNVAYTMKFRAKKQLKKDYDMMAPEGLWWMKGKAIDLAARDKWLWTLMVVVPDFVTEDLFKGSVDEVRRRKNPPGLERARLETFDERTCIQIMHIGPYSTEPQSIAKLEAFPAEHAYQKVGKHHEIYLGDPRRAAPSKLKTIIRHQVARVP